MSVRYIPQTVDEYLARLDYLADVERRYSRGELSIDEGETYFDLREYVEPPLEAMVAELRKIRGQ